MNFSFLQSSSTAKISKLTWHLLVEALDQGHFSAWLAEFPECRVVAESEEAAIAALEAQLSERMAAIKVLSFKISPSQLPSDNPWDKIIGLLKDDASFAEWRDQFWAEKQRSLEDDEILSIEEILEMM